MDGNKGYERQSLLNGESVVYVRGSSKVYANRFGVTVESTSLKTQEELEQFAGIVALAWKDHFKLLTKAMVIQ